VTSLQRIAAYNVCRDAEDRLLLVRLSNITERPGWWTLPGGGIEFGEHPENAALRELREETGLAGRIVELLAVDSIARPITIDGAPHDYHSVRIVYRTEVVDHELRDELEGSTDHAAWCTRVELDALPLVEMGRLGVRLAFGAA
jgi:ADP-ribose pyrophosphatase YjhB (NUDIX family)